MMRNVEFGIEAFAAIRPERHDDLDMVTLADVKESGESRFKSFCIVKVYEMRKKHSHRIKPEILSHGKFAVDCLWVECRFLPHFYLVYGG